MSIYVDTTSKIPLYLACSFLGNAIIYLFLNSKEFNFSHDMKQLRIMALTTVLGFIIGYAILKILKVINEIDKASYEYRKTHPVKDEPW